MSHGCLGPSDPPSVFLPAPHPRPCPLFALNATALVQLPCSHPPSPWLQAGASFGGCSQISRASRAKATRRPAAPHSPCWQVADEHSTWHQEPLCD